MTVANETWKHGYVDTNGIKMHYVEQGEGYPVLLLHGFPELWYSWRYQIPALAEAGYRAIAPDLRGYGESDKPHAIEDYDIHHLIADLTGLLDALGVDKAAVAGHDWGAIILWQMALQVPDRVSAVMALNVPWAARSPIKPTEGFKLVPGGRFNYILHFQDEGVAEKEMEADIRASLGGIYKGVSANPEFLSDEEAEVFYSAFAKGGMRGPINFYRNFDRNWETTEHLAGRKVEQPALMIMAEKDPVLPPEMAVGLEANVPNVKHHLVKGSGHWTQQEKPEEVNRVMIDFLNSLQLA
ncbi:MAG: alpha/beta hydrolase [Dehalococcoidia bacterium]